MSSPYIPISNTTEPRFNMNNGKHPLKVLDLSWLLLQVWFQILNSSERSLESTTLLIMVSIPIALFFINEAVINYSVEIASYIKILHKNILLESQLLLTVSIRKISFLQNLKDQIHSVTTCRCAIYIIISYTNCIQVWESSKV